MTQKITLLFFLFAGIFSFAQQMAIGTVTTESGIAVSGASVANMRTGVTAATNSDGYFSIIASPGDELRFAAPRYERRSVMLTASDFNSSLKVYLALATKVIDEVEITFRPSGILKKDVKALDQPQKVIALNTASNNWMKQKPNELPAVNKVPSTIAGPDMNAGQVSLLSSDGGGLLGLVTSKIIGKVAPPPPPKNYAEKEKFFAKVKANIDLEYFYAYGIDEFGFDRFLVYADKQTDFVRKYSRNFNKNEIEMELKVLFKNFMKTYKS